MFLSHAADSLALLAKVPEFVDPLVLSILSDLATIMNCSKVMEIVAGAIKFGLLLVGLMSYLLDMLIDWLEPYK